MSLENISIGMHALLNNYEGSGAPVHKNVTIDQLMAFATKGGTEIIRLPFDLSQITKAGVPGWMLASAREWLTAAKKHDIKVIIEPGQTPGDLSPDGEIASVPDNLGGIRELAKRFAIVVEAFDEKLSEFSDQIAGWEVGNEPNLSYDYTGQGPVSSAEDNRFFVVAKQNAEWYAQYLDATVKAISALPLNQKPYIIAAGIAHNDVDYMKLMLAKLSELGTSVDAFSVHPYTSFSISDDGQTENPGSGRPTDWIEKPDGMSSSWSYYFNFQATLYNTQQLMNQYGYSNSDMWLTELGVPSYKGIRGAGEDGVDDQARWYLEAMGVIDGWDNDNLVGIIAHQILDSQSFEYNSKFNAFDTRGNMLGDVFEAEHSFGLFHEANGEIVAKPAAKLLDSIVDRQDFQHANIFSTFSGSKHDYSAESSSTGIGSGVFALVHDGDDTIIGSKFDDSLFAGTGNDTIDGGAGNDRIYGGSGNDVIEGGAGNDDLYGNQGDDVFKPGSGNDRIDAGAGMDRMILTGNKSDYSWEGDGTQLYVSNGSQTITALNLEVLRFGDGTEVKLDNIDVDRHTGGAVISSVEDSDSGETGNEQTNSGSAGDDEAVDNDGQSFGDQPDQYDFLVGGDSTNDVFIIDASSSNYQWEPTEDGAGYVIWSNSDLNIVWEIEKVQFIDKTIILGIDQPDSNNSNDSVDSGTGIDETEPSEEVVDNVGQSFDDRPGKNDYLVGSSSANDVFIIDAGSSNYQWAQTEDGAGYVIWSDSDLNIVWDIEKVQFTDKTIILGTDQPDDGSANSDEQTGTDETGTGGEPTVDDQEPTSVYGSKKSDHLVGTTDHDTLYGDRGNDVLIGGAGNDQLYGGADSDLFGFSADNGPVGDDIVKDFGGSRKKRDKVDLHGQGFDSFSDIRDAMRDTADGALLSWENGSVLFEGVSSFEFSQSDFLL